MLREVSTDSKQADRITHRLKLYCSHYNVPKGGYSTASTEGLLNYTGSTRDPSLQVCRLHGTASYHTALVSLTLQILRGKTFKHHIICFGATYYPINHLCLHMHVYKKCACDACTLNRLSPSQILKRFDKFCSDL